MFLVTDVIIYTKHDRPSPTTFPNTEKGVENTTRLFSIHFKTQRQCFHLRFKERFRVGLVWTEGLVSEIKLHFQILRRTADAA